VTADKFNEQVARLKRTYGDKQYPAERVKLIFIGLKSLTDEKFQDIVSEAIANNRSAPMLKELSELAARPSRADEVHRGNSNYGTLELLKKTADRAPNKEFANMCVKHVANYQAKRISKAEFLQGCDEIDKMAAQIERGYDGGRCLKCEDVGWRQIENDNGTRVLYRCTCPIGSRLPPLPYKNAKGEIEEIFIPILRDKPPSKDWE
jgi:hypothetical protein